MLKDYLIKLLKGEVSLKITFWIWFVVLSLIIELIFNLFFLENSGSFSYIIFNIFILVYAVLIFFAVFKSANKFVGSKLWSFTSKVIITINLFLAISIFIENTQQGFLEDYSINQEIEFFKENLPITVDFNTELIDIEKEDKTISYTYKFYNTDSFKSSNKRKFIKQVQNSLCDQEGTLEILKKDYILNYTYVDKRQEKLLSVLTDKTACGKSIYDLDILKEILRQQGEIVN